MDQDKIVTAALLIIGDEILSGRTADANLAYMAEWLGDIGIQVGEVRVVPDVEARIVAALNELRRDFDYVLTTGGIGPTHDDITADAVAKAFCVPIKEDAEALARLKDYYGDFELNSSRRRMARMPQGAVLIDNPVSAAPGFQIENVFVLAGVPTINRAMLESIRHRLVGGARVMSRVVGAYVGEGRLAAPLSGIQDRFPSVSIGSYPYYRGKTFGTTLVLRAVDEKALAAAVAEVVAMIREQGAEPVFESLKDANAP